MLFGSFEFYIFFVTIFTCWLICPYRFRWVILLTASYIFYFSWKPWYCLVLFFCTLATWLIGKKLTTAKEDSAKKIFLMLAIAVNLIPLLFFKYFNFLSDSITTFLSLEQNNPIIPHLDILLPIGISFYSFQAISYCVDVYHKKIKPEYHLGHFALYLAFFPKLISGPIERGATLIPQLRQKYSFSSALFYSGIQLFFWGLFKKVVIADRLGMYVDMVFNQPHDYSGKTVILAAWLFALQIYCDFSAYTDMAIGCGRIFGIKLSKNFNFPYFSKSITEFWQRWHITLTSWFRDYVYIPLGGNRVKNGHFAINILAVFILSGLWHGAAWTFILWGALHGVFYLLEKISAPLREKLNTLPGSTGKIAAVLQIFVTFNLLSLAWIFFRAASIEDAFTILNNMFINFSLPVRMMSSQFSTMLTGIFALVFIALELLLYWNSKNNYRISNSIPSYIKLPAYVVGLLLISLFGVNSNEFIYFHF